MIYCCLPVSYVKALNEERIEHMALLNCEDRNLPDCYSFIILTGKC